MGMASPLDLMHPSDQRPLVSDEGPQFDTDSPRTVHYGQRFFQWQYITLENSGCLVLFGQERTREESYRRALEHAVHGIIELNAEGTITNVNEETASLFNYDSVREVTQAYFRHPETFYASDSDRIQLRRDLASGKGVQARDIEMRRADGSQIWVRVNATEIRGEGGMLLGYSVTITDITKNRQAEYDLRRRQERYRALVQTAGSVILFPRCRGAHSGI